MRVTVIFASCKKLGIGDHIVQWQRPGRCPQSMPPEDFGALPALQEVRYVHLLIQRPGFRPTEIILVTTLVDPKRYPKDKLAHLYQLRSSATEVNFKHQIKTTLKMEMIFAKTPEMVQKEIWMHLLAYNLLLSLMWQSAQQSQVLPLRMSLQGARATVQSVQTGVGSDNRPKPSLPLLKECGCVISDQLVPLRPHRAEPRVTKRRPKSFPRMQQPSSVLKAKLVA